MRLAKCTWSRGSLLSTLFLFGSVRLGCVEFATIPVVGRRIRERADRGRTVIGMSCGFVGQAGIGLRRSGTNCASGAERGITRERRRAACVRRARHVVTALGPTHPNPNPQHDETQEYYTNVGAVIDSLREDYPRLTEEEPSLSLYSDYVTFRTPAGMVSYGRPAYRGVLWLLRTQVRMFFMARSLTVLSLYYDKEEAQIILRWRLTGVSRVVPSGSPAVVIDGQSTYTLNDNGFIKDHLLDNVVRIRRSVRPLFDSVLSTATVSARLTGPRVGKPVRNGVPLCYGNISGPRRFHTSASSSTTNAAVNEERVELGGGMHKK